MPHSSRQEGSTEAWPSLLQKWRAWGGQSGSAGFPGKVIVAKKSDKQIYCERQDYYCKQFLFEMFSFLPISRLLCYKCITDTMQELVNQSKAAPQSPSVPKQPGPPVMTSDPNMLSNEEATAHVHKLFVFFSPLWAWDASPMLTCGFPVVWADARSGSKVPGRAVPHRPLQLADSGWPDWQAAGGIEHLIILKCHVTFDVMQNELASWKITVNLGALYTVCQQMASNPTHFTPTFMQIVIPTCCIRLSTILDRFLLFY